MMRNGFVSESREGVGTMSSLPDVSVVVPVHNEVESLPHLLSAISSTLIESYLSYEIICVDDGSTDGSRERLQLYAQKG